MHQFLDTNQTDYRNHGHSYKWHCNSYEIIFYDKMYDLQKSFISDKRAIESDNTTQRNLFKKLKHKQQKKKFEILRMEVRLNKRQKIKQIFKKIGIKAPLTFQKLFKPAISRKILLYYLDQFEQKIPLLYFLSNISDKALLTTLIIHNPHHLL